MAKPFTEWTVLPHGRLTRIDDNILSVSGSLRMPPMGKVERRMTAVRLNDGRLVIYSAIALRVIAGRRLGSPHAGTMTAASPRVSVETPAGNGSGPRPTLQQTLYLCTVVVPEEIAMRHEALRYTYCPRSVRLPRWVRRVWSWL